MVIVFNIQIINIEIEQILDGKVIKVENGIIVMVFVNNKVINNEVHTVFEDNLDEEIVESKVIIDKVIVNIMVNIVNIIVEVVDEILSKVTKEKVVFVNNTEIIDGKEISENNVSMKGSIITEDYDGKDYFLLKVKVVVEIINKKEIKVYV